MVNGSLQFETGARYVKCASSDTISLSMDYEDILPTRDDINYQLYK